MPHGTGGGRARATPAGSPLLVAVVIAAIIGLSIQPSLRWLDRHDAIDIALVVLVFASAVTIAPSRWLAVARAWRPLAAALAAGITVLPALSWLVAQLVAGGPLRDGVLTVGLAPCEIASVATTALAGGDAAVAAGMQVGSTLLSAVVAGPVLASETGGAGVPVGHVVTNLLLVVVAPLAAGLLVRAWVRGADSAAGGADKVATCAVAVLIALVAAQVHISSRYLPLLVALVLFVALSSAMGHLLGRASPPAVGTAVLLTVSMRDFAIAAGLANAAFGPAAGAPLGLYGIVVLVWGAAIASRRSGTSAAG